MTVKLTPEQLRTESGISKNGIDQLQAAVMSLQSKTANAAGQWQGPGYNAFTQTVAQLVKNVQGICHHKTVLANGLGKLATMHEYNEAEQARAFQDGYAA